jgi:hypothetical protein
MAQPYPGYDCEQVTIVASRIPDTIVAFSQTRHNIINISHDQWTWNYMLDLALTVTTLPTPLSP